MAETESHPLTHLGWLSVLGRQGQKSASSHQEGVTGRALVSPGEVLQSLRGDRAQHYHP